MPVLLKMPAANCTRLSTNYATSYMYHTRLLSTMVLSRYANILVFYYALSSAMPTVLHYSST
eukprot:1941782-Prymnesium_polylepis.1